MFEREIAEVLGVSYKRALSYFMSNKTVKL